MPPRRSPRSLLTGFAVEQLGTEDKGRCWWSANNAWSIFPRQIECGRMLPTYMVVSMRFPWKGPRLIDAGLLLRPSVLGLIGASRFFWTASCKLTLPGSRWGFRLIFWEDGHFYIALARTMTSRRAHRKSRRGCLECKQRHVKVSFNGRPILPLA